jgi:hypothetical protein
MQLHLWTFDAQGKVARFRHVADMHQQWLALRAEQVVMRTLPITFPLCRSSSRLVPSPIG